MHTTRPRYTLAELLAEADHFYSESVEKTSEELLEDREWIDAPAVGRELI